VTTLGHFVKKDYDVYVGNNAGTGPGGTNSCNKRPNVKRLVGLALWRPRLSAVCGQLHVERRMVVM
jgi:hypothetical protein